MKITALSTACLLLGTALFAWIGWKIGYNAPPPRANLKPAAQGSPAAPNSQLTAAVALDYTPVAEASWNLRAGRDFAVVKSEILAAAGRPSTVPDAAAMQLIAELSPEEGKSLAADLMAVKPQPVEMIAAALAVWAKESPAETIEFARTSLGRTAFGDCRRRLLEIWAARDPQAAHGWYLAQIETQTGAEKWKLEQDFNYLIYQWALRDLKAATQACLSEEHHKTFDGWFGLGHLAAQPEHRDALFKEIAAIQDEKKRKRAQSSALGAWADSDPKEAALWLEKQPFAKDQDLQWSVLERWSRRVNPEEAADYALRNAEPTDEGKSRALGMALPTWALSDPEAAGRWLEKAGPTDEGTIWIASSWAHKDVGKALEWAMRLPEAKRSACLGTVFAAAKRSDKNFNPANWSKQCGLSEEAITTLMKQSEAQGGRFR